MTVESELKRIADALEAIASNQGIVPDLPGEEEEPEPAKTPTKKKASKKKASKKKASKKASKKTSVGKKKKEVETTLSLKEDVRPVMKRLQSEVSGAAVKSLIKKYGASTLPTLDPKHYAAIIADAKAEMGEEDDDADDIDDLDDDQEDMFGDDLDDDDDDL